MIEGEITDEKSMALPDHESQPSPDSLVRFASLPEGDLFAEVGSNAQGLTEDEARERLERYGPNSYPEARKSTLAAIAAQFRNLFNILLILAAALSFISGLISSDPSSIGMGAVILVVVLLSVVFNLVQERQAERAVRSIQQLVPTNAKTVRSGQEMSVPVRDMVPGDIIVLEEGDKVPADSRVLSSFNLALDNSALTGESVPQHRWPTDGEVQEDALRSPNLVFAGTTVVSGTGTAIVLLTGGRTRFGSIIGMARSIKPPPSPLQLQMGHAARLNFALAMLVGLVFLLLAYFLLHLELAASLLFMIGVMVSLVPEGLQVTMTLSLALSSVAMSRRNVVVKRLSSVETLGSVTTICTDKTGTITEGQMTARWMWLGDDRLRITGEGYGPEGMVLLGERRLVAGDRPDLRMMAEAAALANTATLVPPLDRRKSRWTSVGDPTEAALLAMSAKCGIDQRAELTRNPRVGLIPFESSRKMMTSIHKGDDGSVIAYVKGASSEVLARSVDMYHREEVVPLTSEMRASIAAQADTFAREAFRVLAVAIRHLPEGLTRLGSAEVENQLTFVGLVALYDPPRAGTLEAVTRARNAGIRVIMLTGDHELTADSIARKVGIVSMDEHAAIVGSSLEDMSDDNLSRILDSRELVFARVTPEQKLRIVQALGAKGEIVAVTGDGVNDSPALLEADIGIAMGVSGTDAAKESADMVLMDDDFASIVNGVEEGRAVFDNLGKFITYIFTHNWGELVAFIAFVVLGTPLPLAVVQVLAIDLLMDMPPSLSLTMEPPEPGIMLRPPRSRTQRLFSIGTLSRSMYIGIIVGIFALLLCFNLWSSAGWSLGSNIVPDRGAYLQGTTVMMAGIMAGQIGMLLATRTNIHSAFSVSLSRNRWVPRAIAVGLIILLAIVYLPPLQGAFLTGRIPLIYWPILFAITPVVVLLEEVRKLILRRVLHPESTPMISPEAIPEPTDMAGAWQAPAYEERAPPVVMPLEGIKGEVDGLLVSAAVSEHLGSRLVLVHDVSLEGEYLRQMEAITAEFTAKRGIPMEHLRAGGPEDDDILGTLDRIRHADGLSILIVPVPRAVIMGEGKAMREFRWISAMTDVDTVLVDGTGRMEPIHTDAPPRILLPVLGRFHPDTFKLIRALSVRTMFPDVDVLVTKVVEMPHTMPIYPTHLTGPRADIDIGYPVIRFLAGDALYKKIHPLTLLVRRKDRDMSRFIRERNIDIVILGGDRHLRQGYLDRAQRRIARRAPAVVIVTLPAKGRHGMMGQKARV